MRIENKLESLGLHLPPLSRAIASYIPARKVGNIVYTSGQLPSVSGKLMCIGKVGKDVDTKEAGEAAKVACLNALSAIKGVCENLENIKQIVKLNVFVASDPDFYEQHLVANKASDLLVELFGKDGNHARAAVGVRSLPLNAPVEIELIVELN
ncbi:MAG: RidA family protein [Leptospiraceae bacterium]|nr:RidA family protein [Leptospiraceae bacterium]MCP5493870.1 RidA family protein [Leptospiraceae bacterium]